MIEFNKEGETFLDDISGLKITHITTKSELDTIEADNILEAFLTYSISVEQLKYIQFDTVFLQKLLSRYTIVLCNAYEVTIEYSIYTPKFNLGVKKSN